MLDLAQETYEWTESAPLIEGRFKFQMHVIDSKIYAVGGEGTFSSHNNIEVQLLMTSYKGTYINDVRQVGKITIKLTI